jgi:hypothetical protein
MVFPARVLVSWKALRVWAYGSETWSARMSDHSFVIASLVIMT